MRMEDIVNKVFARSFLGYDMEQVDLFLDEIIERFEQYEAEKKEMLLAMEYLLNKLEHEQQLPITEMRKAIDTGKTQKKRLPAGSRLNAPIATEPQPPKPPIRPEETKPARTIARGAQPPKPVRAPKVNRVRVESEPTEQEKSKEAAMTQKQPTNAPEPTPTGDTQPKEDAPAAGNWLDELLINLIEREKTGYGEPLAAAEQPDCNNGDLDPLATEPEQEQEEELAEESELDSAAIEEEPR
ncbi:MAG: DivIVA domain-containing protein [Christensenella sp.]|nr:DivIVA domain-containing protein [Christensenella sp.]